MQRPAPEGERLGQLAIYRHIGAGSTGLTLTTSEGRLPLRPDLRGPNGPLASALAVFSQDLAGCNVYPIAPMVAPVQIDVHVRDPALDQDELFGTSEIVRLGRTLMVTHAHMYAGSDRRRLVAFTQATWMTMNSTRDHPGEPHQTKITVPAESPPLLLEWLGAKPRPDGSGLDLAELPPALSEPVTLGGLENPAMHGGPIQVLTEATAWHIASQRIPRKRLMIEDLSTAMMAPTRHAPFFTAGEVLYERPGSIDCRIEVRENAGNGRVTAVTFARFATLD
jgi:acyl-coenzyme A thioesterase PaaI-like protein